MYRCILHVHDCIVSSHPVACQNISLAMLTLGGKIKVRPQQELEAQQPGVGGHSYMGPILREFGNYIP